MIPQGDSRNISSYGHSYATIILWWRIIVFVLGRPATKKPKSWQIREAPTQPWTFNFCLMELLIFFRNPTGTSINLVLCVVIFVAVIKVNGGLRQSRRAPSPSGTKPSSTPTFTDGTSGNACSRSQCGISPESKRRRVNSWERWGIQHGH